VGGDPDEVLQEYRDQIDRVHAASMQVAQQKAHMVRLEVRFGKSNQAGSHWDAERKVLLAEISEEERVKYRRNPEQTTDSKGVTKDVSLTDGRVEDLAHAHPRYRKFLDETLREREDYARASVKLSEAFAELEHAKGIQAYLEARLQMMRSLTYAYGAETRLG
jgi:hypothetical protein